MLLLRKITRQGGSAVLRIPRAVLKTRGWKVGDEFLLTLDREGLLIRPVDEEALARGAEAMAKDMAAGRRKR
jgi:antitoxin component of MazEF toxin-antitoxin module